MSRSYQIFTEIIFAGKIGAIAVKSYLKHHKLPVTVYGTKEDFEWLPKDDRIILSEVTNQEILNAYKASHNGLPKLWASLFHPKDIDCFVHFDSDVVFRSNIAEQTLVYLSNGYDLVGCRRNQKDGVTTVACALYGLNVQKLGNWSLRQLEGMCEAIDPLGKPALDFFDPIAFDVIRNGGKLYHYSFNQVGAVDERGSRENLFVPMNREIDVGFDLIHFGGCASGQDAFLGKVNYPPAYRDHAIKRYALHCKLFYNEDIGVDLSSFPNILEHKDLFLNEIS